MEFERKYGAAATFVFPLITAGDTSYLTGATHAAGDTQIIKDEGAAANTSNAFVEEGNGYYSIALTATEMQAARIIVTIIDQGTKAWEDQSLIITTYGNASAQHAVDRSDSVRAGLTALPNAAAAASGGLPTVDGSGYTVGVNALHPNAIDDIWDEDIVAAHGTADTAGLLLRALGALISQRTNSPTLHALLGIPDTAGKDMGAEIDDTLTTSHGSGSWAGSTSDIVVASGTFTGTPTVSDLRDSALSETTDDHYAGLLLLITSGVADGQARFIQTYTGSTRQFTPVDDFMDAPAAGDSYKVLAIRRNA